MLPKWKDVPLKAIDYQSFSTWIGSLSVDGSQRDTALSASRIRQTHQLVGAVLATLLLWALLGKQGSAGLTLPGEGISTTTAMLWELVLTTGLVSVILGTASGAQQIGPLAAIGVGGYIALAGL